MPSRLDRPDHCLWNGDCDHCGWGFCIATAKQASAFYRREEAESRRRYGRGIADARGAHKLTSAERELIKKEICSGGNATEIALRYGISAQRVRYYKRQMKKEMVVGRE